MATPSCGQLSRHCHNQKLRCAANSLFDYSEGIRKEILTFNQSAFSQAFRILVPTKDVENGEEEIIDYWR
jgi:hypothetical protein